MNKKWKQGDEISLLEILDAREHRVTMQHSLLQLHPTSLLSFTMNIAGSIKVTPYTKYLYQVGNQLILDGINNLNGIIIAHKETKTVTGWEGFFALSLTPESIKEYLIKQEQVHPLGRLFDFDVLRPDGSKVSREELGFSQRTCFICDKPAFLCGRARVHSAQELQDKTNEIIEKAFIFDISNKIGMLMHQALIAEVDTTLKPGLVDLKHNGSHKDMCHQTFVKSADALTSYFIDCTKSGLLFNGTKEELPQLFSSLRNLGLLAESSMLKATNGVNTHKGIIFSGGIFCGAIGYLISNLECFSSPQSLTEELSKTCQVMLKYLLNGYKQLTYKTATTHGEKLYVKNGITGIRGEAQRGFPHVLQHGVSLYKNAFNSLKTHNNAGLITLLYYISNTEDTNMIARSDYNTVKAIQKELQSFQKNSSYQEQLEILPRLDEYFISKNISPGGSADMLALTYFIIFLFDFLDTQCYNPPLL